MHQKSRIKAIENFFSFFFFLNEAEQEFVSS